MRAKDAVRKYGKKVARAHVREQGETVPATGWRWEREGVLGIVALDGGAVAVTRPAAGTPLVGHPVAVV